MSLAQDDLDINGHAIEVRINAKLSPALRRALVGSRNISAPGGLGVRMDSALYDGYSIRLTTTA